MNVHLGEVNPLLVCQKCVVLVCSFSALLTGVCLPNAAPTSETAKQSYFDVGPWKRAVFERKVWSEWEARLRSTPHVLRFSSLESLKRKNDWVRVKDPRVRVKDHWRFNCTTLSFFSIVILFPFIRAK